MLWLSVLMAVRLMGLCLGTSLPEPPHQEPLCPLQHSCSFRGTSDDSRLGCSCDATCQTYGDCCRDSEYYDEAEQMKNVNEYMCVGDALQGLTGHHVFVRGKCSEDWEDTEVHELCLKGNTVPDHTKVLYVTSTTTARTYVNHYCAICNGEDPASLRMWFAYVICRIVPSALLYEDINIVNNKTYAIVFNEGKWGIIRPSSGVSTFIPCKFLSRMPGDIKELTTQCFPTIKTCSDSGSDDHEQTLCQSYAAAVYRGYRTFRNQHCASCNGYKEYTCEKPTLTPGHPYIPLAMVLDFTDHTGSNLVGFTGACGTDEVLDSMSRKCRKVLCPKPSEKFSYGRCVPVEDDATLSSETHTTTPSVIYRSRTVDTTQKVGSPNMSSVAVPITPSIPPLPMPTTGSAAEKPSVTSTTKTNSSHPLPTSAPNTSVSVSQDKEDHLSLPPNTTTSYDACVKVLLSEEEFTRQTNGSVYVPAYGRTYQDGEYEDREGGVLVCWSVDSSHKFSPTLWWVSLVGLAFSCLALMFHLTAFCLVPSQRNLSGKCLASLCLSLLAAYTTLLVNMPDPPSQAGCVALAAAMYYFFLCCFAWMTAIAFDVWNTFRLTQRKLRVTGGSQNHRFLAYSLCSWLLPAVSTAVLVTVDQLEPQGVSEDFLPRLGEGWCWFSHRKSLLVFFATPMAVLTLMNVVFFASTAALIAKMNRSAATATAEAAAGSQRPKRYWSFLRLAVLMGLTWTTGIMAGCLDLEGLWYIFVVLNSLQGVFIFLAFTCRTKVFQEVGFRGRRLLQLAESLVSRRPLQPDTSLELQQQMNKTSHNSSSSTGITTSTSQGSRV